MTGCLEIAGTAQGVPGAARPAAARRWARCAPCDGVDLEVRRGRVPGAGGGVGERQDHPRALRLRLIEPDRRPRASSTARTCWRSAARELRAPAAPVPDGLPGPLRLAQSAPAGGVASWPSRWRSTTALDRGRPGGAGRASCWRTVGLGRRSWPARYPHELSGGQRQRVGIARALAAGAGAAGGRRAGLGARRLGAGADPGPAGGPAAAARARDAVHRPRPGRGGAAGRPGGGDVPGPDRGAGAAARSCSAGRCIRIRSSLLSAVPVPEPAPPAAPDRAGRASRRARWRRRRAARSTPAARSPARAARPSVPALAPVAGERGHPGGLLLSGRAGPAGKDRETSRRKYWLKE